MSMNRLVIVAVIVGTIWAGIDATSKLLSLITGPAVTNVSVVAPTEYTAPEPDRSWQTETQAQRVLRLLAQ